MRLGELLDPLLTSRNVFLQVLDYPHRLYHQDAGLDHGPVMRGRDCLADRWQLALLILAIVSAKEGP
jgi:hypothetical protein